MPTPTLRSLAKAVLPGLSVALTSPGTAMAQDARASAEPAAGTSAAAALQELPEVLVRAREAEAIRNAIQPSLGSSAYGIDRLTIDELPGGTNQSLNAVLLQAPGVVQDSFGELHVRGDHRNVQYRLNGVTLPESIGGFGSILEPRSVRNLTLITGALPAQYGYRTAGVVDITLRSGALEPGGSVGVYGGSRGTVQPFVEYGGVAGGWEYFLTGNWLRTMQGVENPTASRIAENDGSNQWRGLAYAARQIDQDTRLSIISGGSYNHFRIPTRADQQPAFTAFGVSDFDSRALRESQTERTIYNIVALNQTLGAGVDLQTSFFSRYNSIRFTPDRIGDLVFNGVASDVRRSSNVYGIQQDGSWAASSSHTLRGGGFVSRESTRSINRSFVLPLDPDGAAIDDPFRIDDSSDKVGWLYGAYLQDEWRLTDRLTVNTGARLDYLDGYVKAAQLSPRANLVWRPAEGTALHAGYARYFTPPPQELIAPASLALVANTTLAPDVTRNDRVRPERSHYFDIGLGQAFGPLTLGVDGYYRIVRDLLDEGQFGNALVFSPFNYRRGRVAGVEVSGSYRADDLLVYANLAVSRSVGREIVSGQFNIDAEELAYIGRNDVRTDHDQRLTGSAGAVYRAWEGGRLSASYLYGSGLRRGFANTGKLPDYNVVNVGVAQDFRMGGDATWTARLDVLNLLDNTYVLRDGSGIGVGAPQYGTRRGFFVGLSRSL